jgi:long-chain acyl-CoA synthetase
MTAEIEHVPGPAADTWPKMLRHNYEEHGDERIAMRHKQYGIWRPYTWKDYYINVKRLALGLLSLGFAPGDRLLIVGDNAPEWYYAELAAQANHGVSVGAYSELTPKEIEHIARESEARVAVVEDQEQVDKLLQIKERLPLLERIIYWDYKGLAHYEDPSLMGYQKVLDLGDAHEEGNPGLYERNVESGRADDVCAIVYTSGTTGDVPKGALHTFKTTMAGAQCYLDLDPWRADDNSVPFLPPAWMTEQWLWIGCHLLSANVLNFAEGPETQQQDAREIGPSIVVHGARTWEAQASRAQVRIQDADALKRRAFRALMPIGYKVADARLGGQKPGPLWRTLYALANVTMFRPLKDSLGLSKARICYATGAMLSPSALRFYHALNLPLKSVYSSTEGGPLAGAKTSAVRVDTVGPVHAGVELTIAGDGELLYRHGATCIGYCGDPARTEGALKDGWFHSGDIGYLTEDGHLVLVGRQSDLAGMAGGQTLAPQAIESRLRFSPFIRDAWVVPASDRSRTCAIVIIDRDAVGKWAREARVAYESFVELSQSSEVRELVRSDIEEVNESLAPSLRISRFVNLHKEFDPDEAELTRTRKLRRMFLERRYRKLVDAIDGDQAEVSIEAEVRYRDGRMRTVETTLVIGSVGEASL